MQHRRPQQRARLLIVQGQSLRDHGAVGGHPLRMARHEGVTPLGPFRDAGGHLQIGAERLLVTRQTGAEQRRNGSQPFSSLLVFFRVDGRVAHDDAAHADQRIHLAQKLFAHEGAGDAIDQPFVQLDVAIEIGAMLREQQRRRKAANRPAPVG